MYRESGQFSVASQVIVAARSSRGPKLKLRVLWQELFAKPAHPRLRRSLMIQILAYHIQEQAYGSLKPSTRKRLQRLAAELEQNQKA